ncbi:FMN-linked oxidoreductase, partial [Neoconidiobolus thromboides FSU 785]
MIDISTPHFIKLLQLIGNQHIQLYTEMYHCGAIINMYKNNTLNFLLNTDKNLKNNNNNNIIIQLGGSDKDLLSQACKIITNLNYYQGINLNLGCPSTAVQAGCFGAMLMKDSDKVIQLINSMEQSVEDKLPITIKCRLGVDDLDSEEFIFNFVDKVTKGTDIKEIVVHARKCLLKGLSPKKNRTIPPLNYERVYKLAERFKNIKFSLNGGVKTIEDIKGHLSKYENLNGVMLGRKILDEPYFLRAIATEFYS